MTASLARAVLAAALLLSLFAAPASADLFGPPRNDFPTGPQPTGMASGDFNADGDLDLAVTNFSGSNTVSVLLGAPGAAFGPPTNFAAGSFPHGVATADLNGDGRLDLVVTNSTGLAVLVGGPGGSFAAPASYPLGASARGLAVADFNADGRVDVATGGFGAPVSILLANADGTLGAPSTVPAGNLPLSLAAGDFNGDDDPDLAVANNGSNSVTVLVGGPGGTFTAQPEHPVGQFPQAVETGDFDGDGDPDLAVVNIGSGVSVLMGDAGAGFEPQTAFGAGLAPGFLAVADFDADGDQDLSVSNLDGDSVTILLGRAGGGFATQPPTSLATPNAEARDVLADDFDGDGRADLAVAARDQDRVVVLRNIATPAIATDLPSLTFAAQARGTTSASARLVVRSTGDRALAVRDVRTAGLAADDYAVVRDGCTGRRVAPGGTCELALRFTPEAEGQRAATLVITSDAPALDVPLGGTGGSLPAGPAGPAGMDRDRLVAAFASARHRAAPRRRVRVGYVTTVAGPVTVELRRRARILRRVRATAAVGRNTAVVRAPRRRGRYSLVLTARAGAQTATDRARLTIGAG